MALPYAIAHGHPEENVIGKEVYYAGTVRASPAKREAGDNENK